MESILTAVFLPLALFIIMVSMGMGLTWKDFQRVTVEPQAAFIGLIAQLILLPIIGFSVAKVFSLAPELAVGLMVIAACPGGPTSNLITYLIKGNVALSITLTAFSSLITVFTIPLVVNIAMQVFLGETTALRISLLETTLKIAVITIIPISLGMLIARYAPQFAVKAEKLAKYLSIFFLAIIILGIVFLEKASLSSYIYQVGGAALALNLLTMVLGYSIATIAKLPQDSVKAIAVEVGVQNGTLAIAIASSPAFLNNSTIAVPAGIYSLLMYVTCGLFGWCLTCKVNLAK